VVLGLAVPAFLALVSEPLFLLADAAIVGHLGTRELAALGIAAAVVSTAVGLCIFLAYGTTASVSRQWGAGDKAGALKQGIDGLWLAVLIGVLITGIGLVATDVLVAAFDPPASVTGPAEDYLRVAWWGVTPTLLVLAGTGVLRGFLDTRTPLRIAVGANLANIALNFVFVYPLGFGLVGSAIGTDIAQFLAGGATVAVIMRRARTAGVSMRPDLPGVRRAAHAGVALVLRTLTLRACLLVMTFAVARHGETPLATHQLAMTIWTFLAFALDALAIAAQALTGRLLGAGDLPGTRTLTAMLTRWGLWCGVVTGIALAAISPFLGRLFSGDEAVVDALVPVLLVAALFQPLAGVVFVLDGILIGAGDGTYLAWAGAVVAALFTPAVLLASNYGPSPVLPSLWAVFGAGFIGTRAVILVRRSRTPGWMVAGGR
jgi:putative MATE family efflux protein